MRTCVYNRDSLSISEILDLIQRDPSATNILSSIPEGVLIRHLTRERGWVHFGPGLLRRTWSTKPVEG